MTAVARAALLVLLLALAHVQAAQAVLSILARSTVLSVDHPATQHLDELASQAVPCADPAGETRAGARVIVAAGGVVLLPETPAHEIAARSLGITRAPPAA